MPGSHNYHPIPPPPPPPPPPRDRRRGYHHAHRAPVRTVASKKERRRLAVVLARRPSRPRAAGHKRAGRRDSLWRALLVRRQRPQPGAWAPKFMFGRSFWGGGDSGPSSPPGFPPRRNDCPPQQTRHRKNAPGSLCKSACGYCGRATQGSLAIPSSRLRTSMGQGLSQCRSSHRHPCGWKIPMYEYLRWGGSRVARPTPWLNDTICLDFV